jgi:hypothetical protein
LGVVAADAEATAGRGWRCGVGGGQIGDFVVDESATGPVERYLP